MVCRPSAGTSFATSFSWWVRSPKRRHHVPGKQFLRLDDLPVVDAAEVRHDGKLRDRRLFPQLADLSNHLRWRSDEGDLLRKNVLVGQLRQRFERTAGIEAVS